MALSRTGKVSCMAVGTVPYLLLLASRSRVRGRKWIELNIAPARAVVAPLPVSLPPLSPDTPLPALTEPAQAQAEIGPPKLK